MMAMVMSSRRRRAAYDTMRVGGDNIVKVATKGAGRGRSHFFPSLSVSWRGIISRIRTVLPVRTFVIHLYIGIHSTKKVGSRISMRTDIDIVFCTIDT